MNERDERALGQYLTVLEDVLSHREDGKQIPYKAHMALDYGGIHPNPEEHLSG